MRGPFLIPLLSFLSLAACGDEASKSALPPSNYHGPKVSSQFDGAAVVVVVQAPTAGYELKRDGVKLKDGTADVEVTLTSPADGEVVAQVVTPVQLRIAAPELQDAKKARILVASVMRGASYLVAPAHELAAEAQRQ